LLIVLACAAAGSPLLRDYPGLAKASRIQRAQLLDLRVKLEAESIRNVIALRLRRRVQIPETAVDDAWMIATWGLQGWLDLEYPKLGLMAAPDPRARMSRIYREVVVRRKLPDD
jgi:hypothetical protein